MKLAVRKAKSSDEDFLFELRNDATVILWSVSGRGVSSREHHEWFSRVIDSPDHFLLIGEISSVHEGDPQSLGMVRFDKLEVGYLVTIGLLPEYRGLGFGRRLLEDAISNFQARVGHVSISLFAQIHSGNIPSVLLFKSLGFKAGAAADSFLNFRRDY